MKAAADIRMAGEGTKRQRIAQDPPAATDVSAQAEAATAAVASPEAGPEVDFSKTREVGSTRWLRLETLTFTDEKGTTGRAWDRAVRTTKQSETSTDAVAILAVLTQKQPQAGGASEETVVLVKQFRPPINAYTIELPAGLIDEGETPAQAALRELKEECGYIGEVTSVSPYLAMSPGMTNESIMLVTVDVDLSLPANQEPQQNLDEGEFCEVLKVPTASLIKELLEFDKQGVKVFCGLWCLAHGMSVRMGAHASK